ncbi:MAG: MGMT family protein [Victivallales bacterium]|nr:MGMT family protein [Victivallales bacterium]
MMKKYAMRFQYGAVPVIMVWRHPFRVERLLLDRTEIPPDAEAVAADPAAADFWRRLLLRDDSGRDAVREEECDLSPLTPFQRRILSVLRREVPAGQVVSYGRLAVLAGAPRAARAVGQVMHRNPLPLVFPCHRVVAAAGGIGGFQGGTGLKRRLLAAEGMTAAWGT